MPKLTIDVAIPTWPNHPKRIEYFTAILDALDEKLTASRHEWRVIVSTETEPDPLHPWCMPELEAICDQRNIPLSRRESHACLGGAMNSVIRACESDIILLVQDDQQLRHPLDISDGIDLLQWHPEVDIIRYSFPEHPVKGTRFAGKIGGWRKVDMCGPWPYGDDPHLFRRSLHDKYGWFAEDVHHGRSESAFIQTLASNDAVIVAADRRYFANIGAVASVPTVKEWRKRKEQRE